MNIVKIECPKCEQPIELPEADARVQVHCPSCKAHFMPEIKSGEAFRTRENAVLVRTLSGVCFLFSGGALLALLLGAPTTIAALVAGGLFSLALTLQIIAQLLFIRAALESKP